MKRRIVGFHQDERQDWVADLECGHGQHVRHNPPWMNRPWVVTPEGREPFLGVELDCKKCDENAGDLKGASMARTVEAWLDLVARKDASGMDALLAEDVAFHSPLVDTPQSGKERTRQYLTAAFGVFSQAPFRYVRQVVGEHNAVLEFLVEIDGVAVNGVDMLRWDDEGRIVEVKVLLRPMKALRVMQLKMAALLQAT
ncbi:MAG TPA: DUF3565 domain-containing protein [Thermoanaerobaculia bacterium]|nr:DUF3565 domain-containing protein [Thermoanaerobaculia bacterium]